LAMLRGHSFVPQSSSARLFELLARFPDVLKIAVYPD
jgi:hypothetical protein